jgi:hypothetical protein
VFGYLALIAVASVLVVLSAMVVVSVSWPWACHWWLRSYTCAVCGTFFRLYFRIEPSSRYACL